jgi:hypothetical protein
MSDEGETALKRFEDLATLQFYIHDNDAPIFLPEPQTEEEREAFERIRDIEQAHGRTVTPMDVERFNQLVPEWEATCDAMNAPGLVPGPTEAQAEAMAFEAARRQYLKEQFISGRDELPELDDLPQPNEAQEPEPPGPDIEP